MNDFPAGPPITNCPWCDRRLPDWERIAFGYTTICTCGYLWRWTHGDDTLTGIWTKRAAA